LKVGRGSFCSETFYNGNENLIPTPKYKWVKFDLKKSFIMLNEFVEGAATLRITTLSITTNKM
jgi:hypothetical protein